MAVFARAGDVTLSSHLANFRSEYTLTIWHLLPAFVISQVSHHPMIVACHCEGRGWKFWGDSNLKSKFWGRSIQVDPVGILTLKFDDGEVFQWTKVHACS